MVYFLENTDLLKVLFKIMKSNEIALATVLKLYLVISTHLRTVERKSHFRLICETFKNKELMEYFDNLLGENKKYLIIEKIVEEEGIKLIEEKNEEKKENIKEEKENIKEEKNETGMTNNYLKENVFYYIYAIYIEILSYQR
jgi:hypothetical protein